MEVGDGSSLPSTPPLSSQGKMSQAVIKMEVGDEMLMKGPKGRLEYKPNMKAHIGELGRRGGGDSGTSPA